MLKQLQDFIEQHIAFLAPNDDQEQLQLASIALLLEMVIADDHANASEYALVASIVKKSYTLSDQEAATLIDNAEKRRKQATDYFEFTSLINQQCTLDQKIQLIESLWRIAFFDGTIDPQEEYLVRKIANLLHISHEEFIKTKTQIESLINRTSAIGPAA